MSIKKKISHFVTGVKISFTFWVNYRELLMPQTHSTLLLYYQHENSRISTSRRNVLRVLVKLTPYMCFYISLVKSSYTEQVLLCAVQFFAPHTGQGWGFGKRSWPEGGDFFSKNFARGLGMGQLLC